MKLTVIAAPSEVAAKLKADTFENALPVPPSNRVGPTQTEGFRFVRGEGDITPSYHSFSTPCVGVDTGELYVVLIWH